MQEVKSISVNNREELISVLGPLDKNVNLLKKKVQVKVFSKNNKIFIKGSQKAVDIAYSSLTTFIEHLRSRHYEQENEEDLFSDILNTTIEKYFNWKHSDSKSGQINSKIPLIKRATPKTAGQALYVQALYNNPVVLAIGPAGTGKTYLAVYVALEYLMSNKVKKIILSRPAVEAGEKLGFLPGSYQQKVNPYLKPLYDALECFLKIEELYKLVQSDIIEVIPLAYMRGRTLDNAFIILDEAQNTTSGQMKMFLTRLGTSSKAVVTGDITQCDIKKPDVSGLVEAKNILKGIPGIEIVYLKKEDIVRNPLVQAIVDAYERR